MAARKGRAPRVVWVDLPRKQEQGERGIRLHYLRWQRVALAEARRLHAAHQFDIVHHVSWGTVTWAPKLWSSGSPVRLGPARGWPGGPARLWPLSGLAWCAGGGWAEFRRNLLPFIPRLRRAAANSALVLATNQETADLLYRAGARHVELFLDNGVLPEQFVSRRRVRQAGERLELLWAGRLEARKALPLALEAMARAPDVPARLTVAGAGPLRAACERQAAALGLDAKVRFIGQVSHAAMRDLFASSDAFLFTSLQDSFGSVVIEAMAAGLPVLGLKHQGFGTLIPEHAAIKIPVSDPATTIQGLADAILALGASPELGQRLGEAARLHASTESWSRRAARIDALYRSCLDLRARQAPVRMGAALAELSA